MSDQPKDQPPLYQQTYQAGAYPPQVPNPAHTQVFTTSAAQPNVPQQTDLPHGTLRMSSEEEEDIYRVDGNVKVGFEDVFPEPSAYEKLAPVRHILNLTFNYVQLAMYGLLMVTAGLFVSIFWALVFGFLNFGNTWFIQPYIKVLFVLMRAWAIVFRAATRAFCDPYWSSVGLFLAGIGGKFKLVVTGVKPQVPAITEEV